MQLPFQDLNRYLHTRIANIRLWFFSIFNRFICLIITSVFLEGFCLSLDHPRLKLHKMQKITDIEMGQFLWWTCFKQIPYLTWPQPLSARLSNFLASCEIIVSIRIYRLMLWYHLAISAMFFKGTCSLSNLRFLSPVPNRGQHSSQLLKLDQSHQGRRDHHHYHHHHHHHRRIPIFPDLPLDVLINCLASHYLKLST